MVRTQIDEMIVTFKPTIYVLITFQCDPILDEKVIVDYSELKMALITEVMLIGYLNDMTAVTEAGGVRLWRFLRCCQLQLYIYSLLSWNSL